MSIFVPLKKGITLCDAFSKLSAWTWDTIRDSARYGLSVGEETITDLLLLSLAKRFPHQVFIRKYNKIEEGTTGADWLWCFVGAKNCFLMQVQAKRIDGDQFPRLAHKVGKAKSWQVDLLLANAATRKAFPAYVFYCYLSAALRRGVALTPTPSRQNWGCSAGAASAIEPLIKSGKLGFADLYPATIFPWREIVCAKNDAAESAYAFAKMCMGKAPFDGLFANCDDLPQDVVSVAEKYRALRGTEKQALAPKKDVGIKGNYEEADLVADDLDGIAIIGDIENSCLMRTE